MLLENLKRRFTAIAIHLQQADDQHIGNIARSAYFRSAIILTTTIVEAIVFELVKIHSDKAKSEIKGFDEHKTLHNIPRNVFGKENITICKIVHKKIDIGDKDVKFWYCYLGKEQIR